MERPGPYTVSELKLPNSNEPGTEQSENPFASSAGGEDVRAMRPTSTSSQEYVSAKWSERKSLLGASALARLGHSHAGLRSLRQADQVVRYGSRPCGCGRRRLAMDHLSGDE
jgi:hypothetical protein